MLTLRPPQHTAKLLTYDSFNDGHTATILCAPTGFGKTVLFSNIAYEMLENGLRTMICVDRVELLEQAKAKLNDNDLHPMVIDPDYVDGLANLYLASVDTLKNRRYPEIDFLIIDEAHKRTFDKIVLYYKSIGVKVMGVTATPVRTGKSSIDEPPQYANQILIDYCDAYRGQLSDVYSDLILCTTMQEQFDNGYLVPAQYTSVRLDISDVQVVNTAEGLEYNQKQAAGKFDKPAMYDGCIANYKKFSDGLPALCFNANVELSKKMTIKFVEAGIPSAHVDGTTNKKLRRQIFKDFKLGRILVLNNCGVATTGYDEPSVRTIIINRLIYSFSLYEQICGRGGRPFTNKDQFLIIDQGANYIRHGYWGSEREYYLDPEKQKRVVTGVAPMVNCPECDSLISMAARKCPFCSVTQTAPVPATLLQAEFELLDMSAIRKKPVHQMTIEELEEYRKFNDYSIGWIVRQLMSRSEQALYEYQRLRNYTKSWADRQIEMSVSRETDAMNNLWEFIKSNGHLTGDQIADFSRKKLRDIYSKERIIELLPDILEAAENYKSGKLNEKGELI